MLMFHHPANADMPIPIPVPVPFNQKNIHEALSLASATMPRPATHPAPQLRSSSLSRSHSIFYYLFSIFKNHILFKTMSCTPSSSKQTRNIRNLDSAKRIERPLDYISQQATTGKTPVKRKRLVKVRVSIQYQTSIVCWLIGTSRHATHATRVSVDVMAWVSLIYFLYLLFPPSSRN